MFSSKLEKSILLRRIANRKRKLKLNRILIGKPEFKHTNDKVIITLYIYNRELSLLKKKIENIKRKLIVEYFFKLLIKNRLKFNEINIIKNILKKIDKLKNELKKISSTKENIFTKKEIYLNLKKVWDKFLNIKITNRKIFLAKSLKRLEYGLDKPNFIKSLNKKSFLYKYIGYIHMNDNNLYNILSNSLKTLPKFKLNKLMYLNILKKMIIIIRLYLRYNKIIFFNKSKFSLHILPLKMYLEKIYKKQVEFNIVNLKNYNLDSNILTQITAFKLRSKRGRASRLIRKLLSVIKLPVTRKLEYYKYTAKSKVYQNFLIKQLISNNVYNITPNIKIKSLKEKLDKPNIESNQLSIIQLDSDKLDVILKWLYPIEYTTSKINNNLSYILKRNKVNTILDKAGNKFLNGVRIEASGRLSKRITAAKSVSKSRQIGSLKDINSSYKKLPSMLLRGNFKSNIQQTTVNGKTRIGAFGVKGWISTI